MLDNLCPPADMRGLVPAAMLSTTAVYGALGTSPVIAGQMRTYGRSRGSATFVIANQKEIGLKLDATRTAVPVLVVDHVEKPSEN